MEILRVAVNLASVEGLEGITIGRLASELSMSKSGLYRHFGSKENLQLSVISHAQDMVLPLILEDIFEKDSGLPRLLAILDNWMNYLSGNVFDGGCFFAAATAEFDDRPAGKVRSELKEFNELSLSFLENELMMAQMLGQVEEDLNLKRLVFQFHAFMYDSNWHSRLFQSREAFVWARESLFERIWDVSTEVGREHLTDKRRTAFVYDRKDPMLNA
jgi:AcrR family transcriptional regulator